MVSAMVRVEWKETAKDLDRLSKSELPYVVARALTETARGASMKMQRVTRNVFNIHSQFVPRGVRFTPAFAKDLRRYGFIEADVHTAPRISTFMPVHETGGTRYPQRSGSVNDKGRSIAIQSKFLRRNIRTGTGKVQKAWKPAMLLKDYNSSHNKRTIKVGRGGKRGSAFIINSRKNNVAMIVRRKSSGSYPLERLFVFASHAGYKPEWGFEQNVKGFAAYAFDKKFKRLWDTIVTG